jgi:hypothetical protein
MKIIGGVLVKQAIGILQSMFAEPPAENADPRLILVHRARKEFQPNRVQSKTTEPEHPLQRYRIIAPAFRIFRRESAAEKNSHCEAFADEPLSAVVLPLMSKTFGNLPHNSPI